MCVGAVVVGEGVAAGDADGRVGVCWQVRPIRPIRPSAGQPGDACEGWDSCWDGYDPSQGIDPYRGDLR